MTFTTAMPTPTATRLTGVCTERYQPRPSRPMVYDAREAEFYTDWSRWGAIDLRPDDGVSGVMWRGGTVRSMKPWWSSWLDHKATEPADNPSRNSAAIDMRGHRSTIHGLHAVNVGDACRLNNATDWRVECSWLEGVRDDAIENDGLASGTVSDCLLDGVYTAFSSRPAGGDDVEADPGVVTIERSLIRLEPQPYPYKYDTKPNVVNVGGVPYSHGAFFKFEHWDSPGRNVRYRIRDSVFLAEHCGAEGVDMPPDELLEECSGVIIIWLGEGEYPAKVPRGAELIKPKHGADYWRERVTDWHESHMDVGAAYKPSRWRGGLFG